MTGGTHLQAVVMGCSAGGLSALQAVLGGLPASFAPAVVICCHTGSPDVELLCDLLQRHSALPVLEAIERLPVAAGRVYIAPSGYHLLVERDRVFSLSADARVGYSRPSIDVLFRSAAEAWGERVAGVVMTGANRDGAGGLAAIRAAGGTAIVEDPSSAEVPAMPAAALEVAGADHVVPLGDIAFLLNQLARQHQPAR